MSSIIKEKTIKEEEQMVENKLLDTNEQVFFKDIGGYKSAKEEARKIAAFFKNYDNFYSKGARLPRGIILYGRPGTGKSMLAKAIACESKVPLIQLTTEAFYREGNISTAVKTAFNEAINRSPSIILIDELDRLVDCSPKFNKSETDKQREALRVLLTEIDKAKNKGVLIIATANADLRLLPDALVRDGRIEKHIGIDNPTYKERVEILKIYLKKHECLKNIVAEDIASYTQGFSGASLASMINEVLITAISNEKDAEFNDFMEPIQAIRCSGIKSEKNKNDKTTIYHELGHFIANYELNGEIGMINVIPHGSVTGIYSKVNTKDGVSQLSSYKDYFNECVVAISGFVSAEFFTGQKCIGAENDLGKINEMFKVMVNNGLFGYETFAIGHLGGKYDSGPVVDNDSMLIRTCTVFFEKLETRSREILEKHREIIEILAKELEDRSVLTHKDIEDIFNKQKSLSN